jgi:hypothetical protein
MYKEFMTKPGDLSENELFSVIKGDYLLVKKERKSLKKRRKKIDT